MTHLHDSADWDAAQLDKQDFVDKVPTDVDTLVAIIDSIDGATTNQMKNAIKDVARILRRTIKQVKRLS